MFRARDLIPDQAITEVTSVEATTFLVDVKAVNQFLGFTVNNGKEVTVEELTKAGFTVEFQSTNLNLIKDAKSGELNPFALRVLTPAGEVIQTQPVTVNVKVAKVTETK